MSYEFRVASYEFLVSSFELPGRRGVGGEEEKGSRGGEE
jgi:hypothetical protein